MYKEVNLYMIAACSYNSVGTMKSSTFILLTILSLSFLSEANFREKTLHYAISVVGGVLFLLLVILAEWKGRKTLFKALFLLSILSSSAFLINNMDVIGDTLQTAVRTSSVALTGVVMCEYSDPRQRIVRLMINSVILRISYFIYWVSAGSSGFAYFIQYSKIVLGLICLVSVMTWPESPYWLASKRRFDESKQAFISVRRESAQSEELQVLTGEYSLNGCSKMIYAPLLTGLPVIFALSINIRTVENYLHLYVTTVSSDQNWLYLLLATIMTVVYVFFALKLPRRLLIVLPSVISFICVYHIAMKQMLAHYVAEDLSKFYVFELPFFYLLTMCAITIVNYPLSVEIIPCKYCSVISAILGFTYLTGELCSPYFIDATLLWIIFCIITSSVTALFLVPEARHRTMIEIEMGYLPEKVLFEPTIV